MGDVNVPTDEAVFDRMRAKVVEHLSGRPTLFVQDLRCGAEPTEALHIRVVTENAWHATFARNMFIRPDASELESHDPAFTVLHAPQLEADPALDGVNSEAFVIVHYGRGEVIIGGTRYAGEIKKSIFSVMNLILPKKGILPMHCSANTNGDNTAIFFGLSGTGKTTLSAIRSAHSLGMTNMAGAPQGSSTSKGGAMRNSSTSPKRMSLRSSRRPAGRARSSRMWSLIPRCP